MLRQFKQIAIFLVSQIFINDALSTAGGTINIVAFNEVGITPL